MSPHEVNVAVVLVTVRTGSRGYPLLHGLLVDSGWPSDALSAGEAPAETALRIAVSLNPLPSMEMPRWCSEVEEVGFSADQGRVTLVYSAVVPTWWAEPAVDAAIRSQMPGQESVGTRWQALRRLPPARGPVPGLQWADRVLEHWRQRLEEEDAALLFLPKYFTTGQIQAVYRGIWGDAVDTKGSNFARWVERSYGVGAASAKASRGSAPYLEPVADDVVAAATTAQIAEVLSLGHGELKGVTMGMAGAAVGTGLALAVLPGMAVGPIGVIAAAAGAGTAYQRVLRARGKKPQWYGTRGTRIGQRRLQAVYEPRPDWHRPS